MRKCYIRGTTPLGIINTILGCIFGIVIVVKIDSDTKKILGFFIDDARNH